ncbi:MAG TPA: response regulator transcription factor [Candidatus Baltobacteraceae bacterium]|nr:response regulator transcription factor [Candidatus Baltobacteraceae bacterium]
MFQVKEPAQVTAPSYRVYVIESQQLLCKALCSILDRDEGLTIVGDSRSYDAEALQRSAPDIVVIGCDAEVAGIEEAVARTRAAIPGVRICVLGSQLSTTVMMKAISAGADGYIVKDVTPAELIASLKRLGVDGFYADPRLSGLLLRKHASPEMGELSPRELEVVRLVSEGLTNKEIAGRLLVSDKTIKNHIANIFSKLNVTARTQIAIYAFRNGIV